MTRRPFWAGRTLALTGILLVALSLRTPVAALSPILDRIGEDIALSPVVLGVIGATPPLAFAASGLLAPLIARRLGLEIGRATSELQSLTDISYAVFCLRSEERRVGKEC